MNEREIRRLEELQSHSGPQDLPTMDLLQTISDDAKSLLKMEVELARTEAKVDMNAELDLAKGVMVASVCGLLGLDMLIISAVFALAPEYAWLVSLIIGFALLSIAIAAAFIGWNRAEKDPFGHTRQSLKEDFEWVKHQIE